jgi:hypothetical protein
MNKIKKRDGRGKREERDPKKFYTFVPMRCGNGAFEGCIKLLFVAPLENALQHLVGLLGALLGVPQGAPRDKVLSKKAVLVEVAAHLLVQLVAPVEECVRLLGVDLAGSMIHTHTHTRRKKEQDVRVTASNETKRKDKKKGDEAPKQKKIIM